MALPRAKELQERKAYILGSRMRRIIKAAGGRPWTRREMARAVDIVASAEGGTSEADLRAFVDIMGRSFISKRGRA